MFYYMLTITQKILTKLAKPHPTSHKGENGRVLIIAGSTKFHGALLLTLQAASRIVDMVYVYSTKENLDIVQKLKTQLASFIAIKKQELWKIVELVDVVIIGPGLAESKETKQLVKKLLTYYPHKKTVVDATALWIADPHWLHKNCIVTPHSREFRHLFHYAPTKENTLKMAKKYGCIVVLKGSIDYISNGLKLWANKTGNVGMTKGGTGDVLTGLIGALAAKNELLTATLAGVYANGLAGDRLYKKVGRFYNAEDLIGEMGKIWKKR